MKPNPLPAAEVIAARLVREAPGFRLLVGIDGVDGSGKTRFAAALADGLAAARPVIVVHVDDFLQPVAIRHARGRDSPEGFWRDTYDLRALRDSVLTPLGAGGDGRYRASSFDGSTDRPPASRLELAAPDAVVLVEGMFLHREELVDAWGVSVFVDVPFAESVRRMSVRDGSHPDPEHETMRRYVGGQRLYFAAARPWERATFVVDNSDYRRPRLIDPDQASAARAIAVARGIGLGM